jgi:DNA invertase Pin-like site-specific DNA recombinase
VLIVWKLDRLGRSLSHLLTIINSLRERKVGFRSLTEGMDTPRLRANCCSMCSARLRSMSEP